MDTWLFLVGNLGFPIVVAFYLLIRFERKIDNLTEAINKMTDTIKEGKDRE
ncbi:YvrJ family protein [Bacillus sp. EB600]|uniref:YvrJ family protein n=1 Tax=Bacillus sp. EB600 TaxID=2806345 RepID=UPI00210E83ED|nr:YvrJ family protein [Bacillus sp. EB600]MCQ6281044.1 YvrJ family protein [Bacillus sp. EB600]